MFPPQRLDCGTREHAAFCLVLSGRSPAIDPLALDENGSPVIVEYKRATNENVINQGLFYLDWLLDHRAEFTLLAMKRLGADIEDQIDCSAPRLVCIAAT